MLAIYSYVVSWQKASDNDGGLSSEDEGMACDGDNNVLLSFVKFHPWNC